MGILKALSWVHGRDYRRVMFEFDAKGVVEAIGANKVDSSEFGVIVGECRRFLQMEAGFSLHFVKSRANGMAHVFVMQSQFYASSVKWLSLPAFVDLSLLNVCNSCGS
ncbi:hypothetical protein PTKIN_Ptkin04bG0049500 [Pterospermum kingtungense]